jgi:hypothetical protein
MYGIAREATLEITMLPVDAFLRMYSRIKDYVSEKDGLSCEMTMKTLGEGMCNSTVTVYPLEDAQAVLDLTDEISGRLGYPLEFGMRNHVPRELLATKRN